MKDVVLVTGASGYVAGHCILLLLSNGYEVRGTLRSLRRAGEVRQWLTKARREIDPGEDLSFAEAELTDAKSWDAAMEGVRYRLNRGLIQRDGRKIGLGYPPILPWNP